MKVLGLGVLLMLSACGTDGSLRCDGACVSAEAEEQRGYLEDAYEDTLTEVEERVQEVADALNEFLANAAEQYHAGKDHTGKKANEARDYFYARGLCDARHGEHCNGGARDGRDGTDGAPGSDGKAGAKGDTGATGPKGDRGDTGASGRDGVDGLPGSDGKDGTDGSDGSDGQDGKPGVDGKNGKNGKDGRDGKDGKRGPKGKDGADGDDGADCSVKSFCSKKYKRTVVIKCDDGSHASWVVKDKQCKK